MGERADSCPTPIFALKKGETKLFHIYCVSLFMSYTSPPVQKQRPCGEDHF